MRHYTYSKTILLSWMFQFVFLTHSSIKKASLTEVIVEALQTFVPEE